IPRHHLPSKPRQNPCPCVRREHTCPNRSRLCTNAYAWTDSTDAPWPVACPFPKYLADRIPTYALPQLDAANCCQIRHEAPTYCAMYCCLWETNPDPAFWAHRDL